MAELLAARVRLPGALEGMESGHTQRCRGGGGGREHGPTFRLSVPVTGLFAQPRFVPKLHCDFAKEA